MVTKVNLNFADTSVQTLWVPVGAMTPRTSNGAGANSVELTTNKIMVRTLAFDAAADEFAQFSVRMPKGWNEGTITAAFRWSHALFSKTGTYSQSGTTVTVTRVGHGFVASQAITVDATTGTAVDGNYTIATVPTADTFTYTAGTSLTTSGNITVTAAASTTDADVVWGIQAVAVSNDDAMDVAFGAAQTVTDTCGTKDDIYETAATGAVTIAGSPAEGDMVIFQVYRDADAGGDTLAVDARLHGVTIYYTAVSLDDA